MMSSFPSIPALPKAGSPQRDSAASPSSALITVSGCPRERADLITSKPITLTEAMATFHDIYSPRIVGRVNDYDVKIAHAKGEHVWHVHEHTDEFFLVLEGVFDIALREGGGERTVSLGAGGDVRGAPGHRAQALLVRRLDPDVRAIGDVDYRRPPRGRRSRTTWTAPPATNWNDT